jgi:hypothetical protein
VSEGSPEDECTDRTKWSIWTKAHWNQQPRMTTSGNLRDAKGIALIILQRQPRIRLISPNIRSCQAATKSSVNSQLFAPLRTTDMDTETIGAENTLPEQEAPRKSGRPPPTAMTSTTNLIRL